MWRGAGGTARTRPTTSSRSTPPSGCGSTAVESPARVTNPNNSESLVQDIDGIQEGINAGTWLYTTSAPCVRLNFDPSVVGVNVGIKENINLDLLEMSDDDEEFEDVSDDKYVDTTKIISMKCVYIPRFKKWKPIAIAKRNDHVSNEHQIINLERKNTR